ncbi:MerR family transcriptional regulator [Siphonobacter sp. BAB-5405]|uniref:chaperone modulator CbpM n=1 Tax=Siphonobacter sp. BAB-5405 TaxID=1864825 RepID=UPI000C8036DD|nr:chaperone modulator CbpM [Siphonobacter sp. BAB-5405]PMD96574.1 MerR family transcriptional regulator [Siphonobacter sp. BAB-5405]
MERSEWIAISDCCTHYNIEISFVDSLQDYGLIEITRIQESQYIHEDRLPALERFIRLHYDLNINLEGIDVITQLVQQVEQLQHEIALLRSQFPR